MHFLQLQLADNILVVGQNLCGALLAPWLPVKLERKRFENDVAVGSLVIDGDELASARVPLLCRVKGPEGGSTEYEEFVVHNVLAQASAATPAECVHGMTLAEVGIPGK